MLKLNDCAQIGICGFKSPLRINVTATSDRQRDVIHEIKREMQRL
jgi:hypothetical protein